jgi:hypothetical protein
MTGELAPEPQTHLLAERPVRRSTHDPAALPIERERSLGASSIVEQQRDRCGPVIQSVGIIPISVDQGILGTILQVEWRAPAAWGVEAIVPDQLFVNREALEVEAVPERRDREPAERSIQIRGRLGSQRPTQLPVSLIGDVSIEHHGAVRGALQWLAEGQRIDHTRATVPGERLGVLQIAVIEVPVLLLVGEGQGGDARP